VVRGVSTACTTPTRFEVKYGLVLTWALAMRPIYFVHFIYTYLWMRCIGRNRIPRQSAPVGSPSIVMIVWSYLPADPRVEREARALASSGYRVTVLCPHWYPPSEPPYWGPNVKIKLLPRETAHSMSGFPWLMSSGILNAAMAEDAWAYHAHDLNTALLSLVAAAKKRVLCVCDFHEWYSENVTYDSRTQMYRPHSWIKRALYRLIERLALKNASRVVTVCDSIARELELMQSPPNSVAVVRNIPPISVANPTNASVTDLRKLLNIPAEKAIVLYQGGVGPSRGLEPLIEAMGVVRNAVLVIRGPFIELFENEYLERARKAGAACKVYCLPPVPSNRCVEEATTADIGFWTLMPLCKNFTYALPNKVFEYLAANLPIVCAHHAEVAKIVNEYSLGRCFDPESPGSIAAAIEELAADPDLRRRLRANIPIALADLQADVEWGKLVKVYQDLVLNPSLTLSNQIARAA
jgi:glycosyltransferase involved in cell wall biosynthesis